MSKIFIVGQNGYISKYFLNNRDRIPRELISISKSLSNGLDLTKPARFNYNQISHGDFVIFSAAISSPDVCHNSFELSKRVNVSGTSYAISKFVRRGAKVIFFSSDVVYGNSEDTVKNENSEKDPLGSYARMKNIVEERFMKEDSVKIIRLSYVVSKEDSFTKYLHSCFSQKGTVEVYPFLYRNVVSIEDVFQGVVNLILEWSSHSKIINFSGSENLSRYDMLKCFAESNNIDNPDYKMIEPDSLFFIERPKVIKTSSFYFSNLLKREPILLKDVYKGILSCEKEV